MRTETGVSGLVSCRNPHAGAVNIYCAANRERENVSSTSLSPRRRAEGVDEPFTGEPADLKTPSCSVEITAPQMTVQMKW